MVRMHAEMEMSMNSVERVLEYTDIEQEPAAHIEETLPERAVSYIFDSCQVASRRENNCRKFEN